MWEIYKKEIRSFLSSLIAYIVIVVFLAVIGLLMWVYPATNVLDYGYATMETLFFTAPWVFVFLISAITMRSFSEEFKSGTIETLITRPVSPWHIIFAKYFAGLTLAVFAILPTLLYYLTIYQLGDPVGNLDTGAIIGSYIGLVLLCAVYVSMGLFASALTENQIVAFLLGMFLCYFAYTAFQPLSQMALLAPLSYTIENLGLDFHYRSISRGVIDTRDIVYFLSFITLFLGLTKWAFSRKIN